MAPMIVLVSDIKGFTRLSEILAPEDIAQAIGTWYGACEQIVGNEGGAIDKFIGDAVLAYWTDITEKARAHALNAAMALRQAEAGTPVADICRKLEITETTFYRWKKKFGGLGVSELRELRQIRDENRQLKGLVADLTLDKQILQESLRKKW